MSSTDLAADFRRSIKDLSTDKLEQYRQGLVAAGSRLKIRIIEDLLKERLSSPDPELAEYSDHDLEIMIQGALVAILAKRLQREMENRANSNPTTGGVVRFDLKELVQSADSAYREICRDRSLSPSLSGLLAAEAGKWHEWAKLGYLWYDVKRELVANWSSNVTRE